MDLLGRLSYFICFWRRPMNEIHCIHLKILVLFVLLHSTAIYWYFIRIIGRSHLFPSLLNKPLDLLSIYWICVGFMLGLCWNCLGIVLDLCWICHVCSPSWAGIACQANVGTIGGLSLSRGVDNPPYSAHVHLVFVAQSQQNTHYCF